jgi:hypothetical protein
MAERLKTKIGSLFAIFPLTRKTGEIMLKCSLKYALGKKLGVD